LGKAAEVRGVSLDGNVTLGSRGAFGFVGRHPVVHIHSPPLVPLGLTARAV
jgi:hypothetical protein